MFHRRLFHIFADCFGRRHAPVAFLIFSAPAIKQYDTAPPLEHQAGSFPGRSVLFDPFLFEKPQELVVKFFVCRNRALTERR